MAEPLHLTAEERARIAAGLAEHEQISRRLSAETDGLEQNHPHQWAGMNSDMQLILADTLPELLEKLRPDGGPERNVAYTYLDPDPPELVL